MKFSLCLSFFFCFCVNAFALKLTPVVSGFAAPVEVVVAPGEPDRLYVVEQAGTIRVAEKGKKLPGTFLDIQSRVRYGGEMGLLSLAFHPKFALNRKYYVNYTSGSPKLRTVVAEYVAGKKEGTEILTFDQPYSNHNGGQLAFDKQGYLYIAVGDGGSAGDPLKAGQDPNTLLAKILRIDVDAKKPYGIPADNPFAKGGGRPETFAMGLRNPWRFSFDPKTGALFAADVGQDEWEEIDLVEKGGNYGWNPREGAHCYEPRENCKTAGLIDPIHEYDHVAGLSITGGFVYRGKKIPSLEGQYIYGDYLSGRIWALNYDQTAKKKIGNKLLMDTRHSISSFGVDAEGEILVVAHKGTIFRLDP